LLVVGPTLFTGSSLASVNGAVPSACDRGPSTR